MCFLQFWGFVVAVLAQGVGNRFTWKVVPQSICWTAHGFVKPGARELNLAHSLRRATSRGLSLLAPIRLSHFYRHLLSVNALSRGNLTSLHLCVLKLTNYSLCPHWWYTVIHWANCRLPARHCSDVRGGAEDKAALWGLGLPLRRKLGA